MTQKELGDAIGLPANRVAQYEMGYRVPKKPLLEQMAQALQVSPLALQEPNTGNISDIMETLFWMDEDVPGVFRLTTIRTVGGRNTRRKEQRPASMGTSFFPAACFRPRCCGQKMGCWTAFLRSGPKNRRPTTQDTSPANSILSGKSAGRWIRR